LSENPVNRKNTPLPKQLKPGEGETLTLLGEPRIFKVTPAENGGACLMRRGRHLERESSYTPLGRNGESGPGPDILGMLPLGHVAQSLDSVNSYKYPSLTPSRSSSVFRPRVCDRPAMELLQRQ
jgi:hypothetical protein